MGCWSCSACLARQLGRKGCAGSDVEGVASLQWSEDEQLHAMAGMAPAAGICCSWCRGCLFGWCDAQFVVT
jgi:hypothetical protein